MIALEKLTSIQEKNKSLICLGLDIDPEKVPGDLGKTTKGLYDFGAKIIDATSDLVCAYKPNIAFYENLGMEGMSLLRLLIDRVPDDIPIIIDAKRGDIGNTAAQYAEALYEKLGADWVTLSPYMGYDSIRPFLEYKNKGVFILCLTSNTGAKDFQLLNIDGKPLYHVVAEKVAYWDKEEQCGLVVGATQPEQLKEIRQVAKNIPILIPGVGAQGGSLELAVKYGTDNFSQPALINVSRSVLYASNQDDFATRSRAELRKLNSMVDAIRLGKPDRQREDSAIEDTQKQTQADQVEQTNRITIQAPPAQDIVDQAEPETKQENATSEDTQKQIQAEQVDEINQLSTQSPPVHDTDNREQPQPERDETGLPSDSSAPVEPDTQEIPIQEQTAPIPTSIDTPSGQTAPAPAQPVAPAEQTSGENAHQSRPENQADNAGAQPEQKNQEQTGEPEQKTEYRGDHRSRRRFNRRNRSRSNNSPDRRSDGQSSSQPSSQDQQGQQPNNGGDTSGNQGS